MTQPERRLYWFFGVNYFAQGMAGIAYEPISYILKDGLKLGPAESAVFVSWMVLPMTLKPLFGLLTDMIPFAGRRRVPHLIAVSLLTSAGWAALALMKGYSYGTVLALLLIVHAGFVLSDVACDGLMVERGREKGTTGPYQAVQLAMLYTALVVTGLGGGWLAGRGSFALAFGLAALFPLLTAASALWIDESGARGFRETASEGWVALKSAALRRPVWALAAGIFLWSFTPFLGTAQFYYQSEHLKLTPLYIGALSTAAGVAGVAGAAIFRRWSSTPEDSPRIAALACTVGAALSLLYLGYVGPRSVMFVTTLLSAAGVAFRLSWMDLAARAAPKGAEATVFAAYMAVFNIAAMASNAAGGFLYERLSGAYGAYAAMAALSLIGTACTLAALPLLKLSRA